MGAEYWVAGYFVCVFAYLAICLLFRQCRTSQGLRAVLLNLLLAEIIIDVVWFNMYFPAGEYYNHGITAIISGLFLWPAILLVSGIIVVAFSSPRLKADSELKKKLSILALVLLAVVAASLILKNFVVRPSIS